MTKNLLEQFRDGVAFDLIYHGDRQRITVMGHQGPGLIWVATDKSQPIVLQEDGRYNSANVIWVEPAFLYHPNVSSSDSEVDPVAEYQYRTRPVGGVEGEWMKCSKTTYESIRRHIQSKESVECEVRALCVQEPEVASLTDEQIIDAVETDVDEGCGQWGKIDPVVLLGAFRRHLGRSQLKDPSKLIRVRFDDNSLVQWDDSIPDGTYLLSAPIAP